MSLPSADLPYPHIRPSGMERSPSGGTGGGGAAALFRFLPEEVTEMEALVQQISFAIPDGLVLDALANKFTASRHRAGKIPVPVQPKQVGRLPLGDPIQRTRIFLVGIRFDSCLPGSGGCGLLTAGVVLVPETPVLS